MKKLLFTLAFALVALTGNAQSTQKGDVNGDGDVSVNDVAMIVNYILGVANDNIIAANADINGDGEIDINDVMGTVSTILEGNGGNGSGIGDTSQAYLTCPNDHHPHMIDLGLPSGTKWACCNVGADKPEAYGGYYAWGETEEKDIYDWNTYQYSDAKGHCQSLGSDIAGTSYDVAHVKWGGSWRMPSRDQQNELLDNCSFSSTKMKDVRGGQYTGSNGGKIFLPAAGGYTYLGFSGVRSSGLYWLSTQYPTISNWACELSIYSEDRWNGIYRSYGRTVRPVWVP